MNPRKWKVNLNHLFMCINLWRLLSLHYHARNKCSHLCNLWGKFFPAGMICTTTDSISIPVGEMYLHARMCCALAHTSSIPMGVINFSMHKHFLHLLKPLLFSWLWCIYIQGCSVHSLRMSSIPMGAMSELETCFEPV